MIDSLNTAFQTLYKTMQSKWRFVTIGSLNSNANDLRRLTNIIREKDAELSLKSQEIAQLRTHLTETEEHYRFLNNAIPQLLWVSDATGNIEYANEKWTEYTGLSKEEVYAGNFAIHPDDWEPILATCKAAAEKGTGWELEYRIRSIQGDWLWHLARCLPMLDANGTLIKWYGSCTDVHDHKVSRQLALDMVRHLNTITDALPVLISYVDKDQIYRYQNKAYAYWFGGKTSNCNGMKVAAFVGEKIYEQIRPYLEEALRGQAQTFEYYQPHEGKEHTLNAKYIPDLQPSGMVEGIFVLVQDITDLLALEKEKNDLRLEQQTAVESARLKSQFVANMSHEIRTPLNSVVGLSTLLMTTELTETQKKYCQAILSSGDALLSVINDILDFSKIDAGKLDFEDVDFSLAQLLDVSLAPFSHLSQDHAVGFIKDIDEALPLYVRGDPGRLRQVLINLISNAFKFTSAGLVSFKVELVHKDNAEATVRFEVRDSGIGMSPETMQHIFQPFAQGDLSTTRRFGGTGLGLTISRYLTERMGGSISCQSVEGAGSVFSLSIPFKLSKYTSPELLQSLPEVSYAIRSEPIYALVVEDSPLNQMVIENFLILFGCNVEVVETGYAAVKAVKDRQYDIVFMDCQMPGMDGYEASRRIRQEASPDSPRVPIIAFTASAMKGDRERCLEAGMDD